MRRKAVKYSEIRKTLKLDTRKPKIDEGLAAVTHYLQSRNNGAKGNGFGLADFEGITRTISARYYKDGLEILILQEGKDNLKTT